MKKVNGRCNCCEYQGEVYLLPQEDGAYYCSKCLPKYIASVEEYLKSNQDSFDKDVLKLSILNSINLKPRIDATAKELDKYFKGTLSTALGWRQVSISIRSRTYTRSDSGLLYVSSYRRVSSLAIVLTQYTPKVLLAKINTDYKDVINILEQLRSDFGYKIFCFNEGGFNWNYSTDFTIDVESPDKDDDLFDTKEMISYLSLKGARSVLSVLRTFFNANSK